MYQPHYNLNELPFELSPDPKFLFLTPRHSEALSNLEYGLFAAKSLTVLIGEAGTGKTTLLHTALKSERCRNVRCVYVNNPALTREEFVSTLAARFALGPEAAQSKAVLLERLENAVRERRERGEITALVVDEAQCLSVALLEEVRLLANIETPSQKLLPLVLAGQSELGARLEEPSLRQLKQRVALRCELGPFQLTETAAYIASRVEKAGGVPARLFTREAVMAIHEHSRGIPRTISVICDNALMSGMALNRQTVDRAIVLEVCRDFVLPSAGPTHQEPPAIATTAPAPEDKLDLVLSPPQDTVRTAVPDQRISRPTTLEPVRGMRRFSVFGSGLW
jgi:general secretion pathway protein A